MSSFQSFEKPWAIHANCVEVFGKAVLLLGKEGSQKSSLSYALLQRGHVFIADDLVMIKENKGLLWGSNVQDKYLLDLKEKGIVDIQKIFKKEQIKRKALLFGGFVLEKNWGKHFFYEDLLQKKIILYPLDSKLMDDRILFIEKVCSEARHA